jgi:Zn-finger nucleic acid-binding protein
MICPVCRKDALVVEYKNIELDYCPACGGVWFDAGELELLLEAAGLKDYESYIKKISGTGETATAEKKRRCPICQRKMKKTHLDAGNKVLVDICGGGHGIWFDGGEVIQLIGELNSGSTKNKASQDVLAYIGEMFKYRVKK